MFTAANVLFLYAESGVHLGSGQSLGAVDLTIQRERYTDWPTGAGSGLKGALRKRLGGSDKDVEQAKDPRLLAAFGPDTQHASEYAGAVAFTDLRLLLFPVRSMKGVFAWVTCPGALERLRRDLASAGLAVPDWSKTPTPKAEHALGIEKNENVVNGKIVLEENAFTFQPNNAVQQIADWLRTNALPGSPEYGYWRDNLPTHLLLLTDDDFTAFTRFATEVQARVKLNDKKTTTGGSGNLFYQENLPSDTLLYALALAQDGLSGNLNGQGKAGDLLSFVRGLDGQRLQIGGDESVGKGLTCLRFYPPQTSQPA